MCQLHSVNCRRVFDFPSTMSHTTVACTTASASAAAAAAAASSSPPSSCPVPAGGRPADALTAARGADGGGGSPGRGEADGGSGGGRSGRGDMIPAMVATLVHAIVQHVRDPQAITGACSVVWALAWRDEARAGKLAAGGGVACILRAMRVAGESDGLSNELQDAAAGALWSLALSEQGLEVMLASDEARETVEQATMLHPAAPRCQRFGRLLLHVLCD